MEFAHLSPSIKRSNRYKLNNIIIIMFGNIKHKIRECSKIKKFKTEIHRNDISVFIPTAQSEHSAARSNEGNCTNSQKRKPCKVLD